MQREINHLKRKNLRLESDCLFCGICKEKLVEEISMSIFAYIIDNGELIPEEKCAQMAHKYVEYYKNLK